MHTLRNPFISSITYALIVCTLACRAQSRALDELRDRLAAYGGDASAAISPTSRAVDQAVVHSEEAADGWVTPLTLAQLATAC